eukprot:g17028.t1
MRLPNFLQQECTSRTAGKGARKPQSELNAALRNRGGAQAQLRAPRKAQSRGRSRPAEAEKKASKERRPSWAPNAAVLAEQVSEIWSRGVEGVKDTMEGVRDTWRPVREAHTSESALQRLQRRLDDWFKTLEDCTGSPRTGPRLSSNLLRVNGGQGTAHLEVALAWRGIEIKLCLGPSSRRPDSCDGDGLPRAKNPEGSRVRHHESVDGMQLSRCGGRRPPSGEAMLSRTRGGLYGGFDARE